MHGKVCIWADGIYTEINIMNILNPFTQLCFISPFAKSSQKYAPLSFSYFLLQDVIIYLATLSPQWGRALILLQELGKLKWLGIFRTDNITKVMFKSARLNEQTKMTYWKSKTKLSLKTTQLSLTNWHTLIWCLYVNHRCLILVVYLQINYLT